MGDNFKVTLCSLTDSAEDMALMHRFLNTPDLAPYYGDERERDFEFVTQKYTAKVRDKNCHPFFICLDSEKVGYIQLYLVDADIYDLTAEQFAVLCGEHKKVYAFDIFIANGALWSRGTGRAAIEMIKRIAFELLGADIMLVDPKTVNERAIACYRSCGFSAVFTVDKREEQNGILYDSLIMKCEK